MNTWIALLRGINVGGKNILPMKQLRALLEELDMKNVRTYIQSGNCIFDCDKSDALMIATSIADVIEKTFNFRPQVLVITKHDLETAIAGNPYLEGADDPRSVHLFFLSTQADQADLGALEKIQKSSERFLLQGNIFYLHTPEGFHGSKLAAQAEKHLGVPVTARNLRSAVKIAELAGCTT